MEKYRVVRYDDGIYSCVLNKNIKSMNGRYSTKWRNTYYNVELVTSGSKQACESYITWKNSNENQQNSEIGEMKEYSVVRYDDGIYACVSNKNMKSLNGQYSAKWRNTYFNVKLVTCGTKQACESFIAQKQSREIEYSETEIFEKYGGPSDSDINKNHVPLDDLESDECAQDENLRIQLQDTTFEDTDEGDIDDNLGAYGRDDNDPTSLPVQIIAIPINKGKHTGTNSNASHNASKPSSTKGFCQEKLKDDYGKANDQEQCVDGSIKDSVPEIRRGTNKFHCNLEAPSKKKKKKFCIFCKKLFTQLPRHLERAHANEEEVKLILSFPKNSCERKAVLDRMRKKGNFQHNGDSVFNTGILITSRRTREGDVKQYIPCSKCLGFFSKKSLRKHFKKCGKVISTGTRSIICNGRRVEGDISCEANEIVRNSIFPVLRDDHITCPLRYDSLVITYANKMTMKYPKSHHNAMIRSRLRLIGKILNEVKKIDSTVSDFSSLLLPQKYDAIVEAIKIIAQLDSENTYYKSPSTASAAGTLLKKCANIYVTELIKQENHELKARVLDFLKILDEDLSITVNKQVLETQLKQKRKKKNILPSKEDIRALSEYLQKCRKLHFESLKKLFNASDYIGLQKAALTSIQLFNRKRAGEVQRIEIEDFTNYESYDNNRDQEIVDEFPEEWKKDAVNFVRFTIRGKLGREVPVLLYKELLEILNYLIKNREKAGIFKENPYIFAIPQSKHKCLDACTLMRHFSTLCSAKNPKTLRGTILRKDLATKSMVHGDIPVTDMADFMGHDPKIHVDHYRLPRATRDLTRVSRLLVLGSGIEVNGNDKDNIDPANVSSSYCHSVYDEIGDMSPNSPINFSRQSGQDVRENESSLNRSGSKRSTSPMGHIKRRSWTPNEKTTVCRVFRQTFSTGKLPSLKQCQEAILLNEKLQERSPEQIKTWLHNQLKKKHNIPVEETVKRKITRTPWRSSEKSVAHKILRSYINGGSLPSITVCRKIINKCPILRNRTPVQLKLFVNNYIKKNKE